MKHFACAKFHFEFFGKLCKKDFWGSGKRILRKRSGSMIDLNKNQRIHLLSIVACLLISSVISQIGFQEDEEAQRLCMEIGPFERHIDACLSNRIQQLVSVAELNEKQITRLRIVAKGVLKGINREDNGTFYYGNPLESHLWKSNLGRILDDKQLVKANEFDLKVEANRVQVLKRYSKAANEVPARADFVAANLQKHLYLTDQQTLKVTELLKTHLDELNERPWDPMLEAFYDEYRSELTKVLAETQLVFFDRKSLINGIGDRTVWDTDWHHATCKDCHA